VVSQYIFGVLLGIPVGISISELIRSAKIRNDWRKR